MKESAKANENSSKPCCKDANNADQKLVKATELPIHGNPYPSKDIIQDETPSSLQLKVQSIRTYLQPYVSPVTTAYQKSSEFLLIGVAHSQSTIQNLAENQNQVVNAGLISGAGILGFVLSRRSGVFRRLLWTSTAFTGAAIACYPKDAEEKAQLLWYIAKNKLPELAKQKYSEFIQPKTPPNEPPKSE